MTHTNKQSINFILLASFILGAVVSIVGFPHEALAKKVTWSRTIPVTLNYAYTDGRDSRDAIMGWAPGLQNPNVSVTYEARLYDNTYGGRLYDGYRVEVGTRIRFLHRAHRDTDIYWFGTGFSNDSPYGHWVTDAAKPDNQSCLAEDYLGTFPSYWDADNKWGDYAVYVPLNVNPPVTSLQLGDSTAGLRRISDDIYEVTSPGDIVARFVWRETYGKFYYRYKSWWEDPELKMTSGLCVANQFAMREDGFTGVEDYLLTVPRQTVTFNLRAVSNNAANRAPNPPYVWGPTNIILGQSYIYKFRTTDPEGHEVRYFIDWPPRDRDNNEINARRPTADDGTWVTSGTVQTIEKIWRANNLDADGRIRFDVFARDNPPSNLTQGESGRTEYVVDVSTPLNVTCEGQPTQVEVGNAVNWSATISGGDEPYTYKWSDGPDYSNSDPVAEVIYDTSGPQTMWLEVEDEDGNSTVGKVNCGTVTVTNVEMSGHVWVEPDNVFENESTRVRWWSDDTAYCEIWDSEDNALWFALNGDEWSQPLTNDEHYKLMCRPTGSSSGDSLELVSTSQTVTVSPQLTANLSVSASSIDAGSDVDVTWNNINNAQSCVVTSDNPGLDTSTWTGVSPSNTRTASNLQDPTTFTLTCNAVAGAQPSQVTRTAYVDINANACSYVYGAWGACQPDNKRYRTVVSGPTPAGCVGAPQLEESCTYIPPVCTSFDYGTWGPCIANTQTRTVTGVPASCVGGTPEASTRSCPAITGDPEFTATPLIVRVGDQTEVSWNTNGHTCTLSGNLGGGTALLTGNQPYIVNNMTTFTLDCTASGGGRHDVTIQALPELRES